MVPSQVNPTVQRSSGQLCECHNLLGRTYENTDHISLTALHCVHTGHAASRGGKAVLAISQFSHNFPVSLSLKQHKHSKEPEAHVSGACLLAKLFI